MAAKRKKGASSCRGDPPMSAARERRVRAHNKKVAEAIIETLEEAPMVKAFVAKRIHDAKDGSFLDRELAAADVAEKIQRFRRWQEKEPLSHELVESMAFYIMFGKEGLR